MKFFLLFLFFIAQVLNYSGADAVTPTESSGTGAESESKSSFDIHISSSNNWILRSEYYYDSSSFLEGLAKYEDLMSPDSFRCLVRLGELAKEYEKPGDEEPFHAQASYQVDLSFDRKREPKLTLFAIYLRIKAGFPFGSWQSSEPCLEEEITDYVNDFYQVQKEFHANYLDMEAELKEATGEASQVDQ